VWGGNEYDWISAQIVGLLIVGILALVLFVVQELRTPEPIMSMELFRSKVFRVTSAIGFIVGFAMFGSIIYLSIYLQVVRGATPTEAGLQLLPLMIGMLITSIVSGRLITRWGRYKVFPIIGTALSAIGLFLLSRLGADASYLQIALGMFVLGAGLGNVMQVLVLAVQNTIDPKQMGAATSASAFFRSIGGSFGAAAFGAIWAARLTAELSAAVPAGTSTAGLANATASMANIQALPPAAQEIVLGAFARAMDTTFLIAVPIMVIGFILALTLPEVHLSRTQDTEHVLADDAAVPLPLME